MKAGRAKGKARARVGDLEAGVDDATDFSVPSLSQLDGSLRCPICQELFVGPVMIISCSHTFCSLCVRQAFASQDNPHCPSCSTAADEGRLRKNAALEDTVKLWIAARVDLLKLQADAGKAAASTNKNKLNGKSTSFESLNSSDVEVIEPGSPPPRKRARLQDPNLEVECPICSRKLKNSDMSAHLDKHDRPDRTTGRNGWGALMSTSSSTSKRAPLSKKDDLDKKLTKVSYAGFKPRDIKQKLEEAGLPIATPPHVQDKLAFLCDRHKTWVQLWNANSDVSPTAHGRKTRAQLLEDLKEREKTFRGASPAAARLQTDDAENNNGGTTKTGLGEGFSAKAHLQANRDHFAELKRQAAASLRKAAEAKAKAEEPDVEDEVMMMMPPKGKRDESSERAKERELKEGNAPTEAEETSEDELPMPPLSQITPAMLMRMHDSGTDDAAEDGVADDEDEDFFDNMSRREDSTDE